MLSISIKKENSIISMINFNGHCGYDTKGYDIVCASASTSMLTTVNAILEFDKDAIKYIEKENVIIENIKKDNITNTLLNNLENVLTELSKMYPKNIKITKEGGNNDVKY